MHPCLLTHLLWTWIPQQRHSLLCFINHGLNRLCLLQMAPWIRRTGFSQLMFTEPLWISRMPKFSLSSHVSYQKSQENGLPYLAHMWPLGLSSVSFLRLSFCLQTILPPRQASSVLSREVHCFKCSLPGFTSRTCPNCSLNARPRLLSTEPPRLQEDAVSRVLEEGRTDGSNRPIGDGTVVSDFTQRGNFRGGRTFRRGNPPSRK